MFFGTFAKYHLDRDSAREIDVTEALEILELTPDASIRGRAYLGLAELDLALGNYKRARHNLVQTLRFDLPPEPRRRALLMLGDTLERHLDSSEDAIMAYQQIVNEHPQTLESEVAQLRLRMLHHEQ